MKLANSIIDLIGNTPLVHLSRLRGKDDATIVAKLESYNPGGSVKDRIAHAMIADGEDRGALKSGYTIVEPTAGNTGIGISAVGIASGHPVILTMPENVSREKYTLLSAFGAEIILTPENAGMAGAIWEAEEIVRQKPRHFMPNQFTNPANPEIHRQTTAREILNIIDRPVDFFVTGVGTGGTLTGVGEVLKSHYPDVQVVAVEPSVSAVISGGEPGPTRIDGIGAGIIPEILNVDIIDQVLTVPDEEAYGMMKHICKAEGLLVGMSSGANVHAALRIAKGLGEDKTVVTILPDTGERYFSLSQYFEPNTDVIDSSP